MAGTVLTNKGLSLITKLVSAQATLSFSRVAVGTGSVPSGYDPQNMTDLSAYKMNATIESYGVSADQADVAYLVTQISSVGVTAGFAVTEAGVYATDPDDGEILYAYLDLTSDPQYIYASTDVINKFAEITFNVLIGSVSSVTAIVSPGALVKKSDFEALGVRVNNLESPEYDDSGTVSGINSFTDFLGNLVSGTSIFSFFSNLKAGLKFVLHTGQLVNNGLCNEPGKYPLDAAFGKTLLDYYDRLNSDLGNIATNLSNVSTGLAATNIDLDPLKSNRVSHINSNVLNKVNIVLWDADTADTPFKAGNTNRGNGFCITYSSGEPYSCQLAMAVGDSHVFTRNSGPDGWSGWTTK